MNTQKNYTLKSRSKVLLMKKGCKTPITKGILGKHIPNFWQTLYEFHHDNEKLLHFDIGKYNKKYCSLINLSVFYFIPQSKIQINSILLNEAYAKNKKIKKGIKTIS